MAQGRRSVALDDLHVEERLGELMRVEPSGCLCERPVFFVLPSPSRVRIQMRLSHGICDALSFSIGVLHADSRRGAHFSWCAGAVLPGLPATSDNDADKPGTHALTLATFLNVDSGNDANSTCLADRTIAADAAAGEFFRQRCAAPVLLARRHDAAEQWAWHWLGGLPSPDGRAAAAVRNSGGADGTDGAVKRTPRTPAVTAPGLPGL